MGRVMSEEVCFLPIPGFKDYLISKSGMVLSLKSRKLLKPGYPKFGYPLVNPSDGALNRSQYIHRLLAQVFLPNPLALPTVNHKNGNKRDHSLDNLEWVSHSENQLHAFRTGLKESPKGVLSGVSKLVDEEVVAIKRRLVIGDSHKSIAADFGVCPATIGLIAIGKTWKHITINEGSTKTEAQNARLQVPLKECASTPKQCVGGVCDRCRMGMRESQQECGCIVWGPQSLQVTCPHGNLITASKAGDK